MMEQYKKKNILYITATCLGSFIVGIILNFSISYIVNTINGKTSIDWNGGTYSGDILNGKPDGDGVLEKGGMKYSGFWHDGVLKNGTIESDKYIYNGELNGTKFNGYGSCRYKDGHAYWGYWKDDMKEGLGRLLKSDGTMSFGMYEAGILKTNNNFTVGDRVYGIDVSRYQGVIGWQDLYLSCNSNGAVDGILDKRPDMQPVLFAIIRSTQGIKIRDARFESNFAEARRCGIVIGAYHFLTASASGKQQAQYFIDNTPLEKGDFPPVLDIETKDDLLESDFSKLLPIAKEWISVVKEHYGVNPILYTNLALYRKFISLDKELSTYDLWIANPGTKHPDIANCIIWQFSHHGKANGLTENYVDINLFYGTYKNLNKYIEEKGIK